MKNDFLTISEKEQNEFLDRLFIRMLLTESEELFKFMHLMYQWFGKQMAKQGHTRKSLESIREKLVPTN